MDAQAEAIERERGLPRRWILATWAGWVLGIPLIVLLALAGEAIGIGGSQLLVGLGMGTGIGLMQARLLRGLLPRLSPWIWSSAIGLSWPFLVTDMARLFGRELPYFLQWCVAAGGLTVGLWQAAILRSRFRRTGSWVVASALGFMLAGVSVLPADWLSQARVLRGIWGALAFLGISAGGGLVLGAITSVSLARMLRRPR